MQGATGALQIAGSLSGVPYAGAVATLAAGIIETTQRVQVHKVNVPFVLVLRIAHQPIRRNAVA